MHHILICGLIVPRFIFSLPLRCWINFTQRTNIAISIWRLSCKPLLNWIFCIGLIRSVDNHSPIFLLSQSCCVVLHQNQCNIMILIIIRSISNFLDLASLLSVWILWVLCHSIYSSTFYANEMICWLKEHALIFSSNSMNEFW